MLVACKELSLRIDGVHTAHKGTQCISTASSRSVYEHMRKQVLQAYCRNRHAYKREFSDVIYCLIFVDVDIGNFISFILCNYF